MFRAEHFWHVAQGQGLISQQGARVGVSAYNSVGTATEVISNTLENSKDRIEMPHRVILERAHKEFAEKRGEWHFDDFGGQLIPRLEQ